LLLFKKVVYCFDRSEPPRQSTTRSQPIGNKSGLPRHWIG